MNILGEVDSTVIGMNLWFIPQISEHCPKNSPGRLNIIFIWLIRPGTASIFTEMEGIVQACRTSFAVIKLRMGVLKGRITRLSVSRRRIVLLLISCFI